MNRAAVDPSELGELATACLVASGASSHDARAVAEVFLWAEMRGRSPQGVVWTDVFCRRLEAGSVRSPTELTEVVSRFPTRQSLSANHGFGHVATVAAVDRAVAVAERLGMAVVSIRDSSHFGPAGYYAERAADAGLIGLVVANSFPKVAGVGGLEPVLGTNPVGFALPVAGHSPVIGDLSTASLAGSRVREAKELGEPLPVGSIVDADGMPTTDPHALDRGGVMLTMAGGKGFALGILIEALSGGLSGGALTSDLASVFAVDKPVNWSQTVIAIHPELDDYATRLREVTDRIVSADGNARLPGWLGADAAAEAQVNGIALAPASARTMVAVATRLGVEVPDSVMAVAD